MAYISLYRKYRSQSFDDVMGQDHVTRTLQNAIKSGRIGHAYLFCGSRGTGKTTVARLLAKAVNCEQGPTPTPCNKCDACLSITDGSAVDFIELDAASHRGVGDIKDIRENVKYPPMKFRYKVFVIDEAHQLSADAKDAFLKTLEEPPAHAIFVLATTEAHEIPMTIRSRCQQFDFRRGSLGDIGARLKYVIENEGRTADAAAIAALAKAGQGSWRDALSLLEQVLSFSDGELTVSDVITVLGVVDEDNLYEVSDVIARGDVVAAFELAGRVIHDGKDVREFLRAVAGHFRDLLVSSVGSKADGSIKAAERARQFSREKLVYLIETFSASEKELRWSDQHRLSLEMAFMKSITGPVVQAVAAPQPVVSEPSPTPAPARPAPREAAPKPAPRPAAQQPVQQPKEAPVAAAPAPSVPEPIAYPAAEGPLSVGQVRSLWPRVMSHIKEVQGKRLLQGILREASVTSVEGNAVWLGFEPKWEFHIANVQQPTNVEIINKALQAVFGRKLTVKATVVDGSAQGPSSVPSSLEDIPDEAPPVDDVSDRLLQDVLEAFPGSYEANDNNGL